MVKDPKGANAKRSATMKKWHRENDHPMQGRHHSEEAKAKKSADMKKWHRENDHPMQGRHHSEEAKAKKSADMKKWHRENDHPMQGKKHRAESIGKMMNRTQSPETRAKISKAMTGRKASAETRKKMSESANRRDPAYKAKLSAALKGKKKSLEHRAKLAAAKTGTKASPEARAKMSRAHTGFRHTDETKAKIGAVHRGRKRSLETKAKMRESFKSRNTQEYRDKQAAAHTGKKDAPETIRKKSASGTKRYARMSEKEKKELAEKTHVGGKETDPERCVRAVLDAAGVSYLEQEPLDRAASGRVGDFFVEPDTVIEVRGTYDHADPRKYGHADRIRGRRTAKEVWARDAERSRLLRVAGYREICVWQRDLQRNTAETAAKILRQLGFQVPESLKRCSYLELVRAAGPGSRA